LRILLGMDGATLGILAVRLFVVVTMASFGLEVAGRELTAVLRRPVLVLAILAANFLLVPLVGVALSVVLGLSHPVAIGLIVTACAAGSSYSAKLVEVAGGDIRVGVSLMLLLSVVTAVALGPVAAAMVGLLGSATGADVRLDPLPILVTLVAFQLLPLLALMALHRWSPRTAERLRAPAVRASTIMLVVAFIAVVADSGDDVLALGPLPVMAMAAVIVAGLGIGYVIGGDDPSARRATALITGQRSASVAYIAVQGVGLAVATATVVAFALVMLAVNLGIAVGSRRLRGASQPETLADPSLASG
jgi:predicted Na+-dependent transporter